MTDTPATQAGLRALDLAWVPDPDSAAPLSRAEMARAICEVEREASASATALREALETALASEGVRENTEWQSDEIENRVLATFLVRHPAVRAALAAQPAAGSAEPAEDG